MRVETFSRSEVVVLEQVIDQLNTLHERALRASELLISEMEEKHEKQIDALIHALELLENNYGTSKTL